MRRLLNHLCPPAAIFGLAALIALPSSAVAGDWPAWRHDARRGAASPAALPGELHLQWTRQLPAPDRAWLPQLDDRDTLEFDIVHRPVAGHGLVYVACMTTDKVAAYRADTGEEAWRHYTGGPARFAPALWEDALFVAADDGNLTCLDARSGETRWVYRGGAPRTWRVLGNRRVIDNWPARGGPVAEDGVVYFSAGIWPFMGVFIHAVDAATGKKIWTNSSTGSRYDLHQHGGAYAYGGVAPQGYLALADDKVIVPGGRTPPAALDRATGEFLYYRHSSSDVGKGAGGYACLVAGDWFFNHGRMHYAGDGMPLQNLAPAVISGGELLALARPDRLHAHALPETTEEESHDRQGRPSRRVRHAVAEPREVALEREMARLHLRAGDRLYGTAADGSLVALEWTEGAAAAPVRWSAAIEGEVEEMLAAEGRLYAVTRDGRLHCFGAEKPGGGPVAHALPGGGEAAPAAAARAAVLLALAHSPRGHVLVLGAGDGSLIEALARQGDWQVTGLEPDPAKIEAARRRLDEAGLHGRRASLLPGGPGEVDFPPFIASLIVAEEPGWIASAEDLAALHALLRPYGGRLLARGVSPGLAEAAAGLLAQAGGKAAAEAGPGLLLVSRDGPLPGAGQWTHQYADSANTVFSPDQRVRLPLGLLWWGSVDNENVLPRHAAGPRPQVAGGRLVILGVETISARDVYTGEQLWSREFPGIGHPFTNLELEEEYREGKSVYMTNKPGASYIGSPCVTLEDSIYLRHEGKIHRLDPATGETLAAFALPAGEDGKPAGYGHVSASGGRLVTTTEPLVFDDEPLGELNWNATASRRLHALDRETGEILWTREAKLGFRHNAIASSGDRVFVIDSLSEEALKQARRRGLEGTAEASILALDLEDGGVAWESRGAVFGTWLSYSAEHDLLVEGGSSDGRRVLQDEPTRQMAARRGSDGAVQWSRGDSFVGPAPLRGDQIIPGRPGAARSLLTGEDYLSSHLLTGEDSPWSYSRTYGCNTANACEHMIFFRSGAAGFADLERGRGTGNFGGFRSGCTSSMIPADGVLSAPDYTRSCTCSYQIKTSLAMVHRPGIEVWTSNVSLDRGRGPVRRLGVNLGAPGNHMDDEGTLWVHFPEVGGSDSPVRVDLEPWAAEEGGEAPPRLAAARASASSGIYRPHRVLDGDPRTHWTARSGDWIEFTLSRPALVGSVELAWPAGDKVSHSFEIAASLDGEAWTTVHRGESSGKSRELEVAEFAPVEARHLRVIGRGSAAEDSRGEARSDSDRRVVQISEARVGGLSYPDDYRALEMPRYHLHSALVENPEAAGILPWVAASGVEGIAGVHLWLGEEEGAAAGPPVVYEVALHFLEPDSLGAQPGERVFDIWLQGKLVAEGVDVAAAAGGWNRGLALRFPEVAVGASGVLSVALQPAAGSRPPLLSGIGLTLAEPALAGGE